HRGQIPAQVVFEENGLFFQADPMSGQKTGFFLDQRDVRQQVRQLSQGRRVLNLFGYTGAFSVYAKHGGAQRVTTVDSSKSALAQVQINYQLNNLGPSDIVCTDVLSYLGHIKLGDYDLMICDPPAFAKTQQKTDSALRAYQSLNKRCFDVLQTGGIFVTSSCSGRISQAMFIDMLRHAAGNARKDARILSILSQPIDHTHRLAFPEGSYLKTVILEVL
ncbi:MAG: class I SAM-dependent methyltransferase, partial [Candidatus Margulisiibacteriota bacterium]